MDQNNKEPHKQLQIELKEEISQGVYSNLAMITHSASEFVMDYISIMPGAIKAQVRARVVMTPEHIKRLFLALQDNIAKFEKAFGTINLRDNRSYIPPISDFHGEA